MARKCYICGEPSNSLEHVIPNFLGGKISGKMLLCHKHNNDLSTIDDLLRPLIFFANHLNIDRDRGKVPNVVYKAYLPDGTSRVVMRRSDGHFFSNEVNVSVVEDGIQVNVDILSTDKQEKEAQLNQLKKEIRKKGLFLGWSEETLEKGWQKIKNKIPEKTKLISPKFNHQTCYSTEMFPAFLKIAINYYIFNKLPLEFINDKLSFLRDFDSNPCPNLEGIVGWYFPADYYPHTTIHHTLSLHGKKEGYVYCLISLFGVANIMVLLSENYTGENFDFSYCYDLRQKKKIIFNQPIQLNLETFKTICLNKLAPAEEIISAFNLFLSFFISPSDTSEWGRELLDVYLSLAALLNISSNNFDSKRNAFVEIFIEVVMNHENYKYLQRENVIEIFNLYSEKLYVVNHKTIADE